MGIIFNIGESVKLSAFNILQEPIKMLMDNETEAFEKQSLLSKIYVMRATDKFQEEFRSRTSMEGFKPTEDMEVPNLVDFGEGYRKTFRTQIWTSSFVISKQTIEDNQDMDINASAVGFIKSYNRTREKYGFELLSGAVCSQDGFATVSGKKFDVRGSDTEDGSVDGTGRPQLYFHNAHKLVGAPSGKDQSNKFKVAAGVDLSSAGGIERLIDAIESVAEKMSAYTDEKGNLLALGPTQIVIPGGQHRLRDAIEIGLKSKFGSTMGGNGTNPYYGRYEVIEAPYLNGLPGFKVEDQGILLIDPTANKEYLGAVWFDRKPLEVSSYIDPYTKANVWDGRARFGAGFNNYRAMSYLHSGVDPTENTDTSYGSILNADDIAVTPVGGGAIATKAI
jgi:hypothetical protein